MTSIHQIQDEIIHEFSRLNGDIEMTIGYLLKLGQHLPPMPEIDKTDDRLIRGCQSKVWVAATFENDKVYFSADSNTVITKGLISLLIRIFNGQPPEAIVNADVYFMQKNCLDRFIGTHRSNGFAAMISQMKLHTQAYKAIVEV